VAKSLEEWVRTDVAEVKDKPLKWLSEFYFFRDECRPTYSDTSYFFAPADGIILYQRTVAPDEPVVDIKGKSYSIRDALREADWDKPSLVIGIFMTFYDVHVNRIPYPGRLSYRELDCIDTYNHPMLEVERSLLEDLKVSTDSARYLHHNQRVVNRVESTQLGQSYYILQIADYDVGCITPFVLKQNARCDQGHRFSQIRYGSQVDLIVPLSPRYEFETIQPTGFHVQAGVDPVIAVREKQPTRHTGE
jgi:phosphatidylserine decarboxylase